MPCPVIPYVIGNVWDEPFASIWKRHADLLRLDFRGNCPMNETAGREAFRTHAAAVVSRVPRCGRARTDAKDV